MQRTMRCMVGDELNSWKITYIPYYAVLYCINAVQYSYTVYMQYDLPAYIPSYSYLHACICAWHACMLHESMQSAAWAKCVLQNFWPLAPNQGNNLFEVRVPLAPFESVFFDYGNSTLCTTANQMHVYLFVHLNCLVKRRCPRIGILVNFL